MNPVVNPVTMRLAGAAVPQLAALLGLTVGAPAVAANLRGRATGYNNPLDSGNLGTAGFGLLGGVGAGIPGALLSGTAYRAGRKAGKDKRLAESQLQQEMLLRNFQY